MVINSKSEMSMKSSPGQVKLPNISRATPYMQPDQQAYYMLDKKIQQSQSTDELHARRKKDRSSSNEIDGIKFRIRTKYHAAADKP